MRLNIQMAIKVKRMIHSMTAFARHETTETWGNGVWEIRSVNQRYLESYFRLPETLRGLEPVLREKLRSQFNRGKVEVSLRFNTENQHVDSLIINETLAKQLIEKAQWIQQQASDSCNSFTPVEILRWPGILSTPEADMDMIQTALLKGFESAIDDLKDARKREGDNLKALIEQRIDGIEVQVAEVREHYPVALAHFQNKIRERLTEVQAELDQTRLEQELVYLAQKSDIAEELDRLVSHIQETRKILKKGGPCGRRLDFMMQEFNRESNTLSSKSISPEITKAAVEMKVLIEQMREQIQNIE